MKSYEVTVVELIGFLRSKKVCPSSIRSHEDCYQRFQSFMVEQSRSWEPETVSIWIKKLSKNENSQLYVIWNEYMYQLQIFGETGTVPDRHLYLNRPTYERLGASLKLELDEYLESCKSRYTDNSWKLARIHLSGMLIYFEDRGRNLVVEITAQDIISYYHSDFCMSRKKRAVYFGHARHFFEFMAGKQKCPSWYALYLDSRYAPYIGSLDSFDGHLKDQISDVTEKDQGLPATLFYSKINDYINSLEAHGYGNTSISTARHALTVLYLFLEIHSLDYDPEIASAWFSGVQERLPKNWKHWRRLVFLFSEFYKYGDIIPTGRYYYKQTSFDTLPEWCAFSIEDFLDLLKREFHEDSTIRSYRYSCIRLCSFLTERNFTSFEKLDVDTLHDFSIQDQHGSFKGKSTCLTIIRRFIIFLEDTGYISNKNLHLCIDPGCATEEKIIDILTEEQCLKIEHYRKADISPIGLRRCAMVMTGIGMGFRASDVINLKMKDIDWKNRSISIVQAKTKTSLTLPMPVAVGNAIYRYIRYGRPHTESEYVFIQHRAPYGKLTGKTCTVALWSILPERKETRGGFHVTRRTFATEILRGGSGADRVMDALGHDDPTSVMKYLSMDENHMRSCPLSLSDLSIGRKGV